VGLFLVLCCSPRVVGADAPEVAFEVAAGEGAAAVVHVADVEDHFGSGGFGGSVDGIGIGDDEVDALGFAEADLVGLDHEIGGFAAVVDGAEHDHAVAEGELGVHDGGLVEAEVDGLLFETEGLDEPVDGSERVAVAEAGNDGGEAGFGLVAHGVFRVSLELGGCLGKNGGNSICQRFGGIPPPPPGDILDVKSLYSMVYKGLVSAKYS
jgi:hypothetical protein